MKLYAEKTEELGLLIKKYDAEVSKILASASEGASLFFHNYFQDRDFRITNNGFLTLASYKGMSFRPIMLNRMKKMQMRLLV
ncbi:hypothetical protein BSK58_14870 [Paenibacillus odorifer]|nr:hypothetical protein BSK58_14870 [Paenibacillus odorifer]